MRRGAARRLGRGVVGGVLVVLVQQLAVPASPVPLRVPGPFSGLVALVPASPQGLEGGTGLLRRAHGSLLAPGSGWRVELT